MKNVRHVSQICLFNFNVDRYTLKVKSSHHILHVLIRKFNGWRGNIFYQGNIYNEIDFCQASNHSPKTKQNKRKKKPYPPTKSKVERKKDYHNETALNGGKWDYLLVNMQIYTDLSSTFKSLRDHKKDFPWYVS